MWPISLPRNSLPVCGGWGASALFLSFSFTIGEAHAQPAISVDLTGHVAPRCWATTGTISASESTGGSTPAALCNHGGPPPSVEIRSTRVAQRRLPSEAEPRIPLPMSEAVPARAAIEIVVTPAA